MTDKIPCDYSALDHPAVLARIFHPRTGGGTGPARPNEFMIPVDGHVQIGACFHVEDKQAPNILFFHGNGEIVSDYDDLGPVYNQMGMNFFVVDFRGYGRSTGRPTVSRMIADCHTILDFVQKLLHKNGFAGSLGVMGRSLGSASAIELASARSADVDFLIVESGFSHTEKLLNVLGIDPASAGFATTPGCENHEKIGQWSGPLLVLHGEFDQLISFSQGKDLFDACPSLEKTLVKIPGANHNDIFIIGLDLYMQAVKTLVMQ
ncbi:MAG: alpha/beta hydrolase [Desulfotignum sp.]|nr:alpha/beta hydrolase [Desulfotignum sp.]